MNIWNNLNHAPLHLTSQHLFSLPRHPLDGPSLTSATRVQQASTIESKFNLQLIFNVGLFHHIHKLFITQLPILIFITLQYSTIHQLLQLYIIQIIPHHSLQHVIQIRITNIPITIHIIQLIHKTKLTIPPTRTSLAVLVVCRGED